MKFKIYGLCFEFSSMRSEYFIFPPFLQMISFLRGMAFFCVCLFCWPLVLFLSLVSPFVLLCYPFFSALISIRDSGCYRILYIDNDLLISFPFLFMVYVCVCVISLAPFIHFIFGVFNCKMIFSRQPLKNIILQAI